MIGLVKYIASAIRVAANRSDSFAMEHELYKKSSHCMLNWNAAVEGMRIDGDGLLRPESGKFLIEVAKAKPIIAGPKIILEEVKVVWRCECNQPPSHQK